LAGVTTTQPPAAIVGMSVLLPGAANLDSYWQNLVDGVDSITEVPENRWEASFYDPAAASGPPQADRVYCRRGGFVDDLAEIDPTEFGIMPGSVASTEPDQLIALKVAASAVADAGGQERLPARDRIGVILGRSGYFTPGMVRLEQRVRTAHQLIRTLGELAPDLMPEQLDRIKDTFTEHLGPYGADAAVGLVPALAASRIASRLDFRGPAYTLDAACASSLVAVDQAVAELARGRCDLVLAGGVHHCHDILLWSVLTQLRVLSVSQRIRPFDRAADGLLIGEGTGVVALKRLADAERDGDRIYAVIRGTGVASDGRAGSLFNPEPDGQALAVRQAWQAAGLDPAEPGSIGLLEASGTATPVGDQAELTALARVFGPPEGERAVIGSVKSMIGHTMSTGGVAGLIKAALAVHRGVLLPTLGCEDPHPALARTRFRPISSAEPWELSGGQRVRRAAVNSFGFGGINAHLVLEQPSTVDAPPLRRQVVVGEPEQVLRVTAATPSGLGELLNREDAAVRALSSSASPADGCRLGVVNPTPKRLALARRVVAKGSSWRGRSDIWFSPQPLLRAQASARLGFVFPGLESEFSPRVDDVAEHFGLPRPDISLVNAGRHGIAVVTVSRLLDRALRRLRVLPDVVAGHSGGELTAMISAGMYSDAEADQFFESLDPDALLFPDVVFAVLGCGVDRLVDALADRQDIVVSHDNSPNQTIVCGPAAAIDEFVRTFRAHNVVGQVLPLRSGFHTPMMEPYLAPTRAAISRLRLHPPTVPIWSTTLVAPYPANEAEVRTLMVRHLLEPVRFRPLIEAMYDDGVRVFVQVGVGQLGSLIDDTLRGREHLTVAANSPHRSGLDQLRRVVTALWVEGRSPEWPTTVGPRHRGQPVKLNLSTTLVSLNGTAPNMIPGLATSLSGSLSRLDQLAARHPLAAELTGLLRETADSAAAVIGAQGSCPVASREVRTVLQVSTETMPYLRDHRFVRQREDWPNEEDRWPIVPGATLVQHMVDAAEQVVPGWYPVVVHELRLNRWLVAAPAVDVTVIAVPQGTGRVEVSIGQYAQAMIEMGERYPHPPPPWPVDTDVERAPDVNAQEFYAQRWTFHGPRFQGITDLVAQGERHVRGVITTPAAPGGLLDNLAQLVWYWTMSTHTTKRVALPVQMEHMRLFGPHPAAGTLVDATIRFRSVTDTTVEADMQVTHRGRVWAHIEGWRSRRFDSDLETAAAERFPEQHTLSQISSEGWAVLFDRWPDISSRDLIMRGYLSSVERTSYDQCLPRSRRQWLLGRIAVKDAVRQWLWDQGWGPVFPAEVQVSNDERGRPRVTGWPGRMLPALEVSLAHCQQVGVAIVGPHCRQDGRSVDSGGVGIDIEEIVERDDRAQDFALSLDERALIAAYSAETGEPAAVWFTRFWTAKEAVSKAEGTGLRGRPQRFAVVKASPTELTVRIRPDNGPGHRADTYRVRCKQLSNREDQRERHYVVAWTTGPAARAGRTQ
jgi:3-oxoacyl-(acyl-carrier-protein) synthase/malonyl CoA-acyl carrier protein transacylase/phosphopantetheinyl transferase